jgi:PhnB protein
MSDLTPYLCVADSRAAIGWYVEVFQARVKGKPYVMDDGRIGHVELTIGDSLLMMADSFPEVDVEPPDPMKGSAVSLHLEVPDCDAVAAAAVRNGFVWIAAQNPPATVDRPPSATLLDIAGSSTPEVSAYSGISHGPLPFWDAPVAVEARAVTVVRRWNRRDGVADL